MIQQLNSDIAAPALAPPVASQSRIAATRESPVAERIRWQIDAKAVPERQQLPDGGELPTPGDHPARLSGLKRAYATRFGLLPFWLLYETEHKQVNVLTQALADDKELAGSLECNEHEDDCRFDLPTPGDHPAKLAALKLDYGQRFGAVPLWLLQETQDEQVGLLTRALDNNEDLGGRLIELG